MYVMFRKLLLTYNPQLELFSLPQVSPRVLSEVCTLQLSAVHAWPAQIPETVNWKLSPEIRGHL